MSNFELCDIHCHLKVCTLLVDRELLSQNAHFFNQSALLNMLIEMAVNTISTPH